MYKNLLHRLGKIIVAAAAVTGISLTMLVAGPVAHADTQGAPQWGVDFATAGLTYDVGALHAGSVGGHPLSFVARYLSNSSWKNLTANEAASLRSQGVGVVVVWETSATRANAGFGAGQADAQAAAAQNIADGGPGNGVIYFAVDYDASWGAVQPYFQGVASVLGAGRTGIYAGITPTAGCMQSGICGFGWQTYAWSHGSLFPGAQLYQYSNGHNIAGLDTDYDVATQPNFGQWGATGGPTPAPQPQPPAPRPPAANSSSTSIPSSPVAYPGSALRLKSPMMRGSSVATIQRQLLRRGYSSLGRADGVFGPKTRTAVLHFQQYANAHGVNTGGIDGIVGPRTWAAAFNMPIT